MPIKRKNSQRNVKVKSVSKRNVKVKSVSKCNIKVKSVSKRNIKVKSVSKRNNKVKSVSKRNNKVKSVSKRNNKVKSVSKRNVRKLSQKKKSYGGSIFGKDKPELKPREIEISNFSNKSKELEKVKEELGKLSKELLLKIPPKTYIKENNNYEPLVNYLEELKRYKEIHNKISKLNKFLNNTKKILNQSGGTMVGMEKERNDQLGEYIEKLKELQENREKLNAEYIKKKEVIINIAKILNLIKEEQTTPKGPSWFMR